ncbi:MAG: hypothetical protein C0517_05120 [Erythrobacter sp.]|nr:hypothetical protein [Erythrobacter sp.]
MIVSRAILALTALGSAGAVQAADSIAAPNLVPLFADTCLMPGVDHAERQAKADKLSGWQKRDKVTIDVAGLQPSRAIGGKPRFDKVADAVQWSGTVDGLKGDILLLTFEPKSSYRHACVLVVEGLDNAMDHGRLIKDSFKAFGIGGKSVDLVHYFEFAGTLKPGKAPVATKQAVHGEIFSRSRAGTSEKTTHIYVAY